MNAASVQQEKRRYVRKTHHFNFIVGRNRFLCPAPLPPNQITVQKPSPCFQKMNEICWNFLLSACCQILKVDMLSAALHPNDQHKPTGYLLIKCCTAYLHMEHLHRDENGLSGPEDRYANTHNAVSSLHLYKSGPVKVDSCHIASMQLSGQDLKKEGFWALSPSVSVSNRCATF